MDVWQFLGSYWWLVFPLMGVGGAAARGWEQSAKRRHKRRLEIIRAKSELKAAQAAARGKPVAAASAPTAITRPTPTANEIEQLFAAHDAVTSRWLEYELDVAKLIAFPAMSDGRQPLTAGFVRAKKLADHLRPASAKAKITPEQLAEYRAAVTDYEVAFDLAERDARRLRDSAFSVVERKRLDTAQQLLAVAVNEAATPAERQIAYKRVREELDGLISLSDGAIDVLEKQVALQLTTGQTPVPDAAPPASASTPSGARGDADPVPLTPPPAPGTRATPAGASPTTATPTPGDGTPRPDAWPVPSRTPKPRP